MLWASRGAPFRHSYCRATGSSRILGPRLSPYTPSFRPMLARIPRTNYSYSVHCMRLARPWWNSQAQTTNAACGKSTPCGTVRIPSYPFPSPDSKPILPILRYPRIHVRTCVSASECGKIPVFRLVVWHAVQSLFTCRRSCETQGSPQTCETCCCAARQRGLSAQCTPFVTGNQQLYQGQLPPITTPTD